jgi:glucose/arabinose dehydrogenase
LVASSALILLLPVPAAGAAEEEPVVRCRNPGACWITAFAFTPDGRSVLYVERFTGEIRRFVLDTGRDQRWGRVRNVARGGERGVLGIAVDPDWPAQRRVFVYHSVAGRDRNRIVRLAKRNDGGTQRTLLATTPSSGFHNGGTLHFGPDGMLYAATGDAGDPARAQDVRNPGGKILRLTEDGRRPDDNPIPGSVAYSFGHRNSFGFTWDPVTGRLWQTENGPECDDEINLVLRGRNYGWGETSACPDTTESGPNPVEPVVRINPLLAPTGAAFCDGCGLGPDVDGDLLVGTFNDERLYAFDLNAARDGFEGRSVVLDRRDAVLAVEAAPDGGVWFSDVRGIYRLV